MSQPDPPTPTRPSRRALLLSILAGAVVVALVVVAAVVWFVGQRDDTAGAIAVTGSIGGEPVDVVSSSPAEPEALALADLGGSGYLALHPFTIAGDAAHSGDVTLELSLPTALPDGAFVTFAWFDPTIGDWMPVATTIAADLTTVTTTFPTDGALAASGAGLTVFTASHITRAGVDPLGQVWTIVVGGVEGAVDTVGAAIRDAGAGVTEIADATSEWWNAAMADWGSDVALGSQWVMRLARDLLGTGADTPECAPDVEGAVPWVTETDMSDNAMIAALGVEGGNAAVLLCAGPDPADPAKLQVRAAANRSYGFPVRFPDGLAPGTAGMDTLDISTSSLINAGYTAIASGADLILNPGRFILPTHTYSFTVDEATVRASQALTATARIVEYPLPLLPEVLLSGVLGAALSEMDPEDFFGGAMGVFFLARDCDFAQWGADMGWAELTSAVSTCLEALDSDDLQEAATDVARSASGESAERAAAFVSGGIDKARGALGKLKWVALFALTQTVTDYIGDVGTEQLTDMPAWFVNALLAVPPAARWEDVAGTWCGISYPSCNEVVPGTTTTALGTSTISFLNMLGDCFAGLSADDAGGGANLVYCPAGAATPAEIPGVEPGLPPGDDDPDFDRVFFYQGYGTLAWFRQQDVAAVDPG